MVGVASAPMADLSQHLVALAQLKIARVLYLHRVLREGIGHKFQLAEFVHDIARKAREILLGYLYHLALYQVVSADVGLHEHFIAGHSAVQISARHEILLIVGVRAHEAESLFQPRNGAGYKIFL